MSSPLTTLGCTISASGISAPSYADILDALTASYQTTYGSDVYLDPDSQDGQWIAIQAAAINDANNQTILAYNQFSPITAQGVGLSSIVKINGLSRGVPTYSTAALTIIGQAGTIITNGQARDTAGVLWALPTTVTIPDAGSIVVTATATTIGAITAATGTITSIATPTYGWQSVTNAAAATPGSPVETDASLRRRQAVSTSISAVTPIDTVYAAVAATLGVTKVAIYENNTGATDSNTVPPHSISVVVTGGDDAAIAQAIFSKKTPGTGTYGSSSAIAYDIRGNPNTERFFRPASVPIDVTVTIVQLPGWDSGTTAAIKQALVTYLVDLNIDDDVFVSRLYPPAQLNSILGYDPRSATFYVSSITIARSGQPQSASNIVLAFNEEATAGVVTVAGG